MCSNTLNKLFGGPVNVLVVLFFADAKPVLSFCYSCCHTLPLQNVLVKVPAHGSLLWFFCSFTDANLLEGFFFCVVFLVLMSFYDCRCIPV